MTAADGTAPDSAGRWCATCNRHGSRHTDRHEDFCGTAPEVSDEAVEAAIHAAVVEWEDLGGELELILRRHISATARAALLAAASPMLAERDEAVEALRVVYDRLAADYDTVVGHRDEARAERDALAQAIHDGRGILGFDNDGDTTPHTSNFAAYARFWVQDAEQQRKDYDEGYDEAERLRDEARAALAAREGEAVEPSEAMTRAGAEALVRYETSGCCTLGKVCGLCDCFLTEESIGQDTRRQMDRARHVLRAGLAAGGGR